jgi:Carboxypeptidase regulatory-like domain
MLRVRAMNRILLLLVLLSFAALGQTNQPASPDNNAQPLPPGTIQGHVTNSLTGDAVAGASIRLIPIGRRGGNDQSAASQNDGSFLIENVTPGDYFIYATQPGFAANTRGGQGRIAINVLPSQVLTDVALQLTPIGIIRGSVTDPDGNPVAGAGVQAFSTYNFRGRTQLRRVAEANTDERGNYTLKTQEAGQYYVAAESESDSPDPKPDSEQSPPKESPLPLVRTFYPEALNLEGATRLDVSAGQDASQITIRLQRAAAYHIRGKIEGLTTTGSHRAPTISLGFRGMLGSDGLGRVVRPAEDGTFDIPKVLPGSYTLTLTGMDNSAAPTKGSRMRLLARQDIDVGASDVNGVSLAVIPLVGLSGRVSIDGVNNSGVAATRVTLVPRGAGTIGGFQTIAVQSDGTFSVQNVAPGEYGIQVVGTPPGAYVKSIQFNRQDVLSTGLDLTQGAGGEIDIVLRIGSGEVDGSLADSEQMPRGAMMILVPEKPPPDGLRVLLANLQPSGVFTSSNVAPGRYYAFAAEGWSPLWQNPDFLRQIQNLGTSVDVPENGHVQVQLPFITTDQMQAAALPLGLAAQ